MLRSGRRDKFLIVINKSKLSKNGKLNFRKRTISKLNRDEMSQLNGG
jgi:hypothetical protein